MYLSELFLQKLKNDFSEKNLKRSLESCEEEWKKRMQETPGPYKEIRNLTNSGILPENPEENVLFREILDLWDVIREFLEEETYNYEIVRVAQQIGKIHMQGRYLYVL